MGLREREEKSCGLNRPSTAGTAAPEGRAFEAACAARAEAADLTAQRAEARRLRGELQQLRGQRDAQATAVAEAERVMTAVAQLRVERAELSAQLVETRETVILQEVGIYQYRHPLQDAVAYKAWLSGVQALFKDAVKAGSAVKGGGTAGQGAADHHQARWHDEHPDH
jgi:hypothetical protein